MQVYILPTIRINNGQYRGKLSYTEVLRAICAGFTKNAEPKVCMRVVCGRLLPRRLSRPDHLRLR